MNWWEQATNKVKATWRKSGWKTTAIVTSLLAMVFGIATVIQRIELQTHRIRLDTEAAPNWAEVVTALTTALLAIATIGLAIAAFLALFTIRETRRATNEARRARHAETMTEAARRWNDPLFRGLRAKVQKLIADGGEEGLKDEMMKLRETHDPQYYELLTVPDYFEDLAILMKYRAVTFEMLDDSLGITAANYWTLWWPFVRDLRVVLNDDRAYENFKDLGERIRKEHTYSQARDASAADQASTGTHPENGESPHSV